ncbi:MAG: aldo/keto reductase [Chloroflexi bacterium]|nr:aldo/keto reductase [Chloroflexota bacterium]
MSDSVDLPPIRKRVLGKTGIEVSIVAVGGGRFGWSKDAPLDPDVGVQTVWTALECGATLIDTAPRYLHGQSEAIVARALRQRPDLAAGVTVTTKVAHPVPEFDYSYDQVMRSVDWSVKHLEREHFPILYLHDAPLALLDRVMGREPGEPGALAALRNLKDQGIIGNIGVGINDPTVNVVYIETGEFDCALVPEAYSLLNQLALERILPAAERFDMGIAVAEVLEKGFLAVGVRPDVVHRDRRFSPECIAHTRKIQELCGRYGISLAAAAIQYATRHPRVHTAIVGARTPAQARQNVRAAREPIPEDFWAELQPLIRHWEAGVHR